MRVLRTVIFGRAFCFAPFARRKQWGSDPSAAGGGCSEVSEWQILGTATVTVTRAEHGTPRSIPRPYFSPSTLSRQNRRTGSYNTVPTNPATVMPYTSSVSHVRLYRSFR